MTTMAKPLREGNLKFCLDLYNELKTGEENLFFSPYSISAVMSMVLLGSRKNTAKQLKKGLGFSDVRDSNLHKEVAKILAGVKTAERFVNLKVVNKLFPEATFSLETKFTKKCKKFYDATIDSQDFMGNAENARQYINSWVQENTMGKIKNILPQGSLNSHTRLVLANAVCFQGKWKGQFKVEETTRANFFVKPGKTVSVDMMFRSGYYEYTEDMDLKAQLVELPYRGRGVSMVIVLPEDKFGLAELEKKINAGWILKMINQFSSEEVKLKVPKMKLEQEFDLVDALKKLGINDVFDNGSANLKGISPQKGLYVSKVAHKAFIEVDEEGTEAAAATAAALMGSCWLPPKKKKRVTCDHPFMFFLMREPTQTALFCGRLSSV
uniref:Serpin B6-like n=1 Tax=Phallusia mammillata TaxID=59560 RepID=A0A6F9DSJ4_9ASCI|nr:serpin B6-like [Phallusia mammillata]